MEIDLSHLQERQKTALWVGLALLVLAGLALLGRYYTLNHRLLTWQEWQIRKAERLHVSEYSLLCQQTERLSQVLSENNLDPIRAALIAKGVITKSQSVQSPTLKPHVQALLTAAEAITDWGAGLTDYNSTVNALMEAMLFCEP